LGQRLAISLNYHLMKTTTIDLPSPLPAIALRLTKTQGDVIADDRLRARPRRPAAGLPSLRLLPDFDSSRATQSANLPTTLRDLAQLRRGADSWETIGFAALWASSLATVLVAFLLR
jgi:hypothetical protein